MAFHLLTPVWGEVYTNRYVDIFLPAQLPALSRLKIDSVYKISTDHQDIIRKSTAYKMLSKLMPVKLIPLSVDNKVNVYENMSIGYEEGIRCNDFTLGDSYIFLTPDSIWSNNTFTTLETLVEKGYRAVMTIGPRVAMENFLVDFYKVSSDHLGIDPQNLSALVLKHTHKIVEAYIFGNSFHNRHQAALCWRTDDALIAHYFVHHPLLVTPKSNHFPVRNSLDYDLAPSNVSLKHIYVIQDSDELLGVDLAPEAYDQGNIVAGPLKEKHVVEWFNQGWPTDFHRWLGQFTVYIHPGTLSNATKLTAEKAKIIVSRVCKMIKYESRYVLFKRRLLRNDTIFRLNRTINYYRGIIRIRTRIKQTIRYLRMVTLTRAGAKRTINYLRMTMRIRTRAKRAINYLRMTMRIRTRAKRAINYLRMTMRIRTRMRAFIAFIMK